jgi:hypothetical protein
VTGKIFSVGLPPQQVYYLCSMSGDILQQTSALVREPFELEHTLPPGTEAELLAMLADRIAEMLERRPEYLMSLLYRLDVLEEKIHPVMRPDAPEPANVGLARLVLERQMQRAETKRSVKPGALEGLEGWEW